MAVRALTADAEEDQVTGERVAGRNWRTCTRHGPLGPDMMRQPFIHQQLLAWLRTHEVYLGGTEEHAERQAARCYAVSGWWGKVGGTADIGQH